MGVNGGIKDKWTCLPDYKMKKINMWAIFFDAG